MGGAINKLTDVVVRKTKVDPEKNRKIADGGGLYLEINRNGSKYWRLAYRFGGKQKTLALGVYPSVSLSDARSKAEAAKKTVREGNDPSLIKKLNGRGSTDPNNSFQAVALGWLERFRHEWTESHYNSISGRLRRDIYPFIGHKEIANITAPELLAVIRRIEARGHLENAHRALTNTGQVFKYGISSGLCERNPAADIVGAIPRPSVKHMSAITDPKQVGILMQAIAAYPGDTVTRCSLQLIAHVFLRSKEIRYGEWVEIDFDKQEWRVPVSKMKGRKRDKAANPTAYHIVPLATQAIAILREVQAMTGGGKYIFPGARTVTRPISDMTMTNALRRIGYGKDEMHVHGFRAMARTLIRQELRFDEEPIERQLGHAVKGPLGAAYNRADFVEERRRMMQAWGDYLEKLREGQEVIFPSAQSSNGVNGQGA